MAKTAQELLRLGWEISRLEGTERFEALIKIHDEIVQETGFDLIGLIAGIWAQDRALDTQEQIACIDYCLEHGLSLLNPDTKISCFLLAQDPVVLQHMLDKLEPSQKALLFEQKNFKEQLLHGNPDKIRILINNGLDPEQVLTFLRSESYSDTGSDTRALTLLMFGSFSFPNPLASDTNPYHYFYQQTIVSSVLPELYRRLFLSLIFPIPDIDRDQLEGFNLKTSGTAVASFNFLQNYLSEFLKGNKEYLQENILSEFDAKTSKKILVRVFGLMHPNREAGNQIILMRSARNQNENFNQPNHLEALILYNDRVYKINRGARDDQQMSGISIFKKTRAFSREEEIFLQSLSPQIDTELKGAISGFHLPDQDHYFPTARVSGIFLDKKLDSMGLQWVDSIPMKDQTVGNCSWATSKALVLGCFYCVIREELYKKNPDASAEALDELNEKAKQLALQCYKAFTKFNRLSETRRYLEEHRKDPDAKLIDGKLLTRMYEYALRYQDLELVNTMKNHPVFLEILKSNALFLLQRLLSLKDPSVSLALGGEVLPLINASNIMHASQNELLCLLGFAIYSEDRAILEHLNAISPFNQHSQQHNVLVVCLFAGKAKSFEIILPMLPLSPHQEDIAHVLNAPTIELLNMGIQEESLNLIREKMAQKLQLDIDKTKGLLQNKGDPLSDEAREPLEKELQLLRELKAKVLTPRESVAADPSTTTELAPQEASSVAPQTEATIEPLIFSSHTPLSIPQDDLSKDSNHSQTPRPSENPKI